MIAEKTFQLLKEKYAGTFDELTIEDVRFGIYKSAVRLSNGYCGISSTLPGPEAPCDKKKRDFGAFTPLKIRGLKVTELFACSKKTNITDMLQIAVLNALSSPFLKSPAYHIVEDADPIDLVDSGRAKTITIIGAFHSYIKRFADSGNKLHVLELNQNALAAEHRKFYVPANRYPEVVPVSDLIFITGFTLVNQTLEDILAVVPSHAKTVLTGPSSSIIPDILFANRVNIVGAVQITRPDLLFQVVSEAGTGFHLFEYCAKKISVINDESAPAR